MTGLLWHPYRSQGEASQGTAYFRTHTHSGRDLPRVRVEGLHGSWTCLASTRGQHAVGACAPATCRL